MPRTVLKVVREKADQDTSQKEPAKYLTGEKNPFKRISGRKFSFLFKKKYFYDIKS